MNTIEKHKAFIEWWDTVKDTIGKEMSIETAQRIWSDGYDDGYDHGYETAY